MMFYTVLKCQISVWRNSGNFLIVLAVSIRLWKVSGFAPSLTNKLFFLSFFLLLPCPSEWTLILHCGELLDQSAPSSSFPQKILPSKTEKFKLFSILQHPVTLEGAWVQYGNEGDKVPFLEQAADHQISPHGVSQA